ncbi:MAG: hypothetical protein AB8H79_10940 [Myxococcota bacterium]
MTRIAVLALAGLLVAGCGKKTPAPAAAAGAANAKEAASSAITAKMPEGKDAATYAAKLVGTTVKSWSPMSGSSGVKFGYDEMTFSPSGRWSANATLEADFEEIPCKEGGTWEIQDVEDSNTATMMWIVDKTNCAMRETGTEVRVQMVLPGVNKYTINFR